MGGTWKSAPETDSFMTLSPPRLGGLRLPSGEKRKAGAAEIKVLHVNL